MTGLGKSLNCLAVGVELRLLGPVELMAAGRPVDAGAPRQRSVLAALAVDAGRMVESDALIDRVWGDKPPQRVREALWVYISHLRAVLRRAGGPQWQGRLVTHSRGYQLEVEPESVDFHRFRLLTERARGRSTSDEQRAGLLGQALNLWQGQPFAGLTGSWVRRTADAWQRQHLDVLVLWAQAHIRTGNPDAVTTPLTEAIAEHPLAESPVAALMTAYHSLGRNAEALEHYLALRRRLAEELGTDPMPEVQRIHTAILRGETVAAQPERAPVAAQLPAGVEGFSGRVAELGYLSAGHGVPLRLVAGTAGVGKTALALRWAHLAAPSFPDGQLFIDLCGFDPARAPVEPAVALQRFLRALGVDARAIPSDVDEAAALYRSHLSGKRVLVLLDNASSDQQVRPLLPGGAGCAVVVTSRHRLSGLIAREGARMLRLEPLPLHEARDLLRDALAARHEPVDSEAVTELARLCCGLPLALRLAAAHLTVHPHLAIDGYVAQLTESPLVLSGRSRREGGADHRSARSVAARVDPCGATAFQVARLAAGA